MAGKSFSPWKPLKDGHIVKLIPWGIAIGRPADHPKTAA